MNKTALNLIAKALRTRSTHVNANKTWQFLHDTENIGTPCAGGYRLNARDFAHLQTIYARAATQNAQALPALPANADRMDTAAHYRNEKFARGSVFGKQLWFSAPRTPLPLKNRDIIADIPGLLLAVPREALDIARVRRIVVVENGTMLTRWHDWITLLPPVWQDTLLLYRGHGENQNEVKHLIRDLPADAQCAIYPDLDPRGLAIADEFARLRRMSIVIPQHWATFTRGHPFSRDTVFARQSFDKKEFSSAFLTKLATHLRREHLAVMQESCLQTGGLTVEPLHKG